MGAISNMKKNINPKARLMIALTVLLVGGIIAFGIWRIMGSGPVQQQASVSVDTPPTTQNIHRDTAADQVKFGDDTAVGQLYKADDARRADEALTGKGSHVDSLRVNVAPEKEEKIEPKPAPAATSPSNLQKLIKDRKTNAEAAENKNVQQRSQANATFQENPWKAFLDNESKDIQDYTSAYGGKIDQIQQRTANPVAKPAYDESLQAGVTSSLLAENQQFSSQSTPGDATTSPRALQYLKTAGVNPISKTQTQAQTGKTVARVGGKFTQTEYIDQGAGGDSEGQTATASDYPSERIAKSSVSTKAPEGEVVVGQTFYSVLQIGVNTDEISPIRAVMVQKGPLEGAVLTGEPARTGEKAKLTFTDMSLNGKSYKVSAIALDPDTYRSGLADGVDNHTFERYSKLMIASFVDGYSDALQDSQTTTNTDGSSSTVNSALPNAGDQVKMGIGKMGEKFSPIFEKEFDRPPTVTVEPNKSIVIMFMANLDLTQPQ